MKRIFAFLLTVVLLCPMMVLLPVAEAPNPRLEIGCIGDTAPCVDGYIDVDEYRDCIVEWSLDAPYACTDINLDHYQITDDPDLSIWFYATFDKENLYLAWDVQTLYDVRLPKDEFDGYAYEYCCVQFLITPGAPNANDRKYQTSTWSGNYFEALVMLRSDGSTDGVIYALPDNASGWDGIPWTVAASRYDSECRTVYECRVPFSSLGIKAGTDGTQFGLAWMVGVQENYDYVCPGIVEYTDSMAGGKAADNAAIVTLVGDVDAPPSKWECPVEQTPDWLKTGLFAEAAINERVQYGSVILADPALYESIGAENCAVALLSPSRGWDEPWFYVKEVVENSGSLNGFRSWLEDGDILLVVSDNRGQYRNQKSFLLNMESGTELYLFGTQRWSDGSLAYLYQNVQICLPLDDSDGLVGIWKDNDTKLYLYADGTGEADGELFDWFASNGNLYFDCMGYAYESFYGGERLLLDDTVFVRLYDADFSQLEHWLWEAQAAHAFQYTDESLRRLTDAISNGNAILDMPLLSDEQELIDQAVEDLKNALYNLEYRQEDDETTDPGYSDVTSEPQESDETSSRVPSEPDRSESTSSPEHTSGQGSDASSQTTSKKTSSKQTVERENDTNGSMGLLIIVGIAAVAVIGLAVVIGIVLNAVKKKK